MATSNASSFNQSVGGLRRQGNMSNEFNKAGADRAAMLKFDAPNQTEAYAGQIQAKLGATQGSLKGVSDMNLARKKISSAYKAVKASGQKVVSSVGNLVGEGSGRIPQQGVSALSTKPLPPAEITAKTKTKVKMGEPTSGDASSGDVIQTKPSVQTQQADVGAKPDADALSAGDGQLSDATKLKLPDVPEDDLDVSDAPHSGPLPDGPPPPPRPTAQGDIAPTSVADDPQFAMASGQRGDGTLARALGRSRQAVQGVARSNPMNVASLTSGDQTANSTLGNLRGTLAHNNPLSGATGDMAKTSTNVHASITQSLEDFKGQMGSALSDVQSQIKGVAGQVGDVGKGVGAVGSDIASGATKAVEGVSAGLETAGAVADALGPIGDVIGIGMSIFGGIEAHKAHEEQEKAQAQAQATVSAPAAQSTAQATGVSLDTSKQAQATVASHY